MHSAECIGEVKMPRSFIDLSMRRSRDFYQVGEGVGVPGPIDRKKF